MDLLSYRPKSLIFRASDGVSLKDQKAKAEVEVTSCIPIIHYYRGAIPTFI